MTDRSKAIVFRSENEVGTDEFALPALPPQHLSVRALYTMVSPGTELRVLAGNYGAADNYPLIPGCCAVGEIETVGEAVEGFRVGDRISYCPDPSPEISPQGIHAHWGGHASRHIVPVATHPILLPQDANPLDYSITEICAISWRGIYAAQPKTGEIAAVVGQGAIGAFSTICLVALGCKVIAIDIEEYRLERSLRYGAAAAVNSRDSDALQRILAQTDGGADIVVESSGVNPGVELAHKLLRKTPLAFRQSISDSLSRWPRLVYQANYLGDFPINPHGYFDAEGALVLTPTDRGREDRMAVAELIRQGHIDASVFIERIAKPSEAPECFATLRDHPDQLCSVVFDWSQE